MEEFVLLHFASHLNDIILFITLLVLRLIYYKLLVVHCKQTNSFNRKEV